MINLLTAEQKKELRAARLNSVLLRYIVVAAIAFVGITLLALFSFWWLSNRITAAEMKQKANEASTSQYADVKAQGAAFGNNLSKIQSVIANRSHYGTALVNIAGALPAGVTLQSLELSSKFLTTPLKLTATTDSNQAALNIKQTLSESKAFTNVTLDNVDCPSGERCTVNMTATLSQAVLQEGTGV